MKQLKKFIVRSEIHYSLIALLFSVIISSIIIVVAGYSPLTAYGALLKSAFGSGYYLAQTLGTAIPLIFSGLAMMIASKVGVFNIGIEGQIIIGAFPAALVGAYVKGLPAVIHIPLCLLVGMVCGGLWALLAAFLRNRLQINEVILTIMLNYVALYLVDYLVNYQFRAEGRVVKTVDIQESARLTTLVPHSRLYSGIFLAVAATAILWFVLQRTKFGYELRAVGQNADAAEAAGINKKKYVLWAMFLSGALAGLAGAGEVMGIYGYYISNMTTGYGFTGIAIATMGRNTPLGTFVSALLFGALRNGATGMNRSTPIPGEFITVLQALVILFVSTPGIVRYIQRQIRVSKERKAEKAEKAKKEAA